MSSFDLGIKTPESMKGKALLTNWYTKEEKIISIVPSQMTMKDDGVGGYLTWGAFPDRNDNGDFIGGFHIAVGEVSEIIQALIKDANEKLAPGVRFEIRRHVSINYGKTHSMSWVSNERMKLEDSWDEIGEPFFDTKSGHCIYNRLISCDLNNK